MKVGTDGVLLGAWTEPHDAASILDVGTGSGLITLMLAQKSNAILHAIDIDSNAVQQAEENFNNSPWKDKLFVQESSLQNFADVTHMKFDLIVSNPPFFINSLRTPDLIRSAARHDTELTHNELLACSKKLLNKTGRICLILPVNEGLQSIEFARSINLYCNKLVYVFPTPKAKAKRVLLEFSFEKDKQLISSIEIETNVRHQYSYEFTGLVKDYYLNL